MFPKNVNVFKNLWGYTSMEQHFTYSKLKSYIIFEMKECLTFIIKFIDQR